MRRLDAALTGAADPGRAAAMAAYMRDQFPFLGVPGPQLKAVLREALGGLPEPSEADLAAMALACWRRPEREYQYAACAWLRQHVSVCTTDFIEVARYLIVTKSWWDTVDTLAVHTVGPLVRHHPSLAATMDEWATGDHLWLTRAALLHQLTYRHVTDAQRLFRHCEQAAEHPDFFIRKAIGWALREYSRTDPAAVRAFVAEHQSQLSPLSRREALRNLP